MKRIDQNAKTTAIEKLNALHAFIAVLQDVEYIDVRRCDFDAVWLVVGSQGPEFKIIEAPLNGSQTTRKDSILKTMVPYDTFKTDMNRFLIAIVDRQKQGQEAAAADNLSPFLPSLQPRSVCPRFFS